MSRNGRLQIQKAFTSEALQLMHHGWEFGEQYFEDFESAELYRDRWLLAGRPPKKEPKKPLKGKTRIPKTYAVAGPSSSSSVADVT
jgi:hypothetical protein